MTQSHHESDELVALLRGELGRERWSAVTDHLRSCASCARSLVEVAAAHSALEAAGRLLGRSQPTASTVPTVPAARTAPTAPTVPTAPSAPVLPPLVLRPQRRGRPRLVAASVAAAVLVAAGGVVALVQREQQRPQVASVALRPVSGDASGRVTMTGTVREVHMTVSTHRLPSAGAGRFYFAWLLDPGTSRMLPLGVVTSGDAEAFDVSSDLVSHYSAVDISLEDDDGDPAHSDTSVLRASY